MANEVEVSIASSLNKASSLETGLGEGGVDPKYCILSELRQNGIDSGREFESEKKKK